MSVNKHTMPTGYSPPHRESLSYYQNLQTTCPADATKPRCPAINTGNPPPAITN
jgi:alpha-glucuronidase